MEFLFSLRTGKYAGKGIFIIGCNYVDGAVRNELIPHFDADIVGIPYFQPRVVEEVMQSFAVFSFRTADIHAGKGPGLADRKVILGFRIDVNSRIHNFPFWQDRPGDLTMIDAVLHADNHRMIVYTGNHGL